MKHKHKTGSGHDLTMKLWNEIIVNVKMLLLYFLLFSGTFDFAKPSVFHKFVIIFHLYCILFTELNVKEAAFWLISANLKSRCNNFKEEFFLYIYTNTLFSDIAITLLIQCYIYYYNPKWTCNLYFYLRFMKSSNCLWLRQTTSCQ